MSSGDIHVSASDKRNDVFDRPNMLTNTGFHRRRDPKGLMNTTEVIPHIEESDLVHVVLDLLT
jgi:hypothetical protein